MVSPRFRTPSAYGRSRKEKFLTRMSSEISIRILCRLRAAIFYLFLLIISSISAVRGVV